MTKSRTMGATRDFNTDLVGVTDVALPESMNINDKNAVVDTINHQRFTSQRLSVPAERKRRDPFTRNIENQGTHQALRGAVMAERSEADRQHRMSPARIFSADGTSAMEKYKHMRETSP